VKYSDASIVQPVGSAHNPIYRAATRKIVRQAIPGVM
jgi:hypothetical protein